MSEDYSFLKMEEKECEEILIPIKYKPLLKRFNVKKKTIYNKDDYVYKVKKFLNKHKIIVAFVIFFILYISFLITIDSVSGIKEKDMKGILVLSFPFITILGMICIIKDEANNILPFTKKKIYNIKILNSRKEKFIAINRNNELRRFPQIISLYKKIVCENHYSTDDIWIGFCNILDMTNNVNSGDTYEVSRIHYGKINEKVLEVEKMVDIYNREIEENRKEILSAKKEKERIATESQSEMWIKYYDSI